MKTALKIAAALVAAAMLAVVGYVGYVLYLIDHSHLW